MAGLTRGKIAVVISVVVALLFVMLYVNFINPLQKERKQLSATLENKQAELQRLTERLAAVGQVTDKEKIQLAQVRHQIPEQPYPELLIRDIRMLEVISGLRVTNYMFLQGQAAQVTGENDILSKAVPLQYTTNVTGEYNQLYRFLEELQTGPRLMQVNSITFNSEASVPVTVHRDKQELSANVTLTAYYVPDLKAWFKKPLPIDTQALGQRAHPLQ